MISSNILSIATLGTQKSLLSKESENSDGLAVRKTNILFSDDLIQPRQKKIEAKHRKKEIDKGKNDSKKGKDDKKHLLDAKALAIGKECTFVHKANNWHYDGPINKDNINYCDNMLHAWIESKVEALCDNSQWTNIKFIVGKQQKKAFCGLTSVFALHSPHIRRLLFGDLKEKEKKSKKKKGDTSENDKFFINDSNSKIGFDCGFGPKNENKEEMIVFGKPYVSMTGTSVGGSGIPSLPPTPDISLYKERNNIASMLEFEDIAPQAFDFICKLFYGLNPRISYLWIIDLLYASCKLEIECLTNDCIYLLKGLIVANKLYADDILAIAVKLNKYNPQFKILISKRKNLSEKLVRLRLCLDNWMKNNIQLVLNSRYLIWMRKKNIIKLLKQISYNSQKHKDVIETNKAFVPPWIVFDACQRWSKNIAQFYAQRVTSTISSVVGSTSAHAAAAAAAAVGGGGGAHRGTIGDAKSGKTKKHHKTHKIGNNGANKGLHFQYSFQSSQQSLASVASSTSMTSVTSTGTASTTSQKSHSKMRHNGTRERYYKHHHHRQSRHKRRENREKHGNHGNHGNHGKHMKMGQRRGVRNHGNHHQQLVDRVKSGDSILSVHQYSIQSSQTRSSVSLSSDEDINVDSKMKREQDSSANSSDCGSRSDSACDSQGNNNNNNNENESEMNESGAGSHSEFHNWQSIMRDFVEYIPFDKMNIHYFDENVLHSGILTKLELNQLDKMRNESNLANQHNEEKEHSKEWRVNIWQKQARFNQEAKNAASLCGEQYLHKAVFRASKRSLNYIEENYLSLVKINDKNVTLRKDFDSNEYECGDNNGDKDDNKNNMNDKKEDGPCLGLFGMKKSSLMCDNDIRNEMESIMKSVCDTVFIIGQNGKKYYGIGALFGIENVDVNNFGSKHGPPGHGPPGNGKNVVTWPHVNESTFEYISMLFYGLKPRMMSFNHDIVGTLLFCHNFQLNERLQYSCIKALHILFMRKLKQDNQNGMKYIVNTMQHMMKNGLFEIVFSMLLKNDYNLAKDLFRHENLVNFLSNDVSLVICFLKELCKNDKSEVITSEGKHVFLNSMQLGHRFLICNNKWNKQECSVCYRLFSSDKDDNGEYILKKNGNGFWDLPLLFVKFLLKADRSGLGCNENIQLTEDMIYQSCKLWCQYHHPIGSDWIESMRNEFAPFINFKSINALYFINNIKPLGIINSEQCFEILEHFIKHPNLFEKNEKKTSSAPAPQAEAALESTIPSTAPPPTAPPPTAPPPTRAAGVVREEAKDEEKKEEIKQEGTEKEKTNESIFDSKENESVDNMASEKGKENEEESMSVQSGNGTAPGKGKIKKKRRKQKKSNGQAFQSMQSVQTMHGVGPHGVTAHGVVAHGVAHGVTHGGGQAAQQAQQAQQQAFQCISQTYSIQSLQSIQSIQSLQSLQSVQSIDGKGSKRKKSRKGKGNNGVNGVNVVPSQQIVDIMSCRPSTQSVPYYYCNDNLARIEPRPIVIPHSQSINIVSMQQQQQQSGNGQSGNSQNENGVASNNSKKRKKKNRNSRRKGQAYQVENQSNIVIFDKNNIDLTKTMVFDSKGNAINSVHFHK